MENINRIMTINILSVVFILSQSLLGQTLSAERTLARSEDFVVMTGGDVSSLLGAETSKLRLYSCHDHSCKPVPFQVDKVDTIGRYVFPQDINNDRDGTLLDQNDEMCLMAGDAGNRLPDGWRPEGFARGVEIELRDPLDNGLAWVYLFEEPGSVAPALPDYVSYRKSDGYVLIESPQFVVGYRSGSITYDIIRMPVGGGKLGPDVLDRQRVGIDAQIAGDLHLLLSVPESIIKGDDVAVIDGKVRVIIDTVVLVKLGELSVQWGTEYFVKFYRCGQNNVGEYEFPAGLTDYFQTVMLYWSLDFVPDIAGSFYIDEHHPNPIPIKDEAMAGVPDDKDHFWWGLYGDKGALLHAVKLGADITPYFTCRGKWRQNPEARIRVGDHPGRLEIGFNCHEIGAMPEMSDYSWLNYILFPKEPTPQGLRAMKNIYEHPLEVLAKDLTAPARAP